MTLNKQTQLVVDPQVAEKEFQKEIELKKKLEVLKGPVFRNFTIKKSKSVIHPVNHSSSPYQMPVPQRNMFNLDEKKSDSKQGVTMIKFELASLNRSKSHKFQVNSKNLPTFSPRKTCQPKRSTFFFQNRIKSQEMNPESTIRRSVSMKVKAMQTRDSQTLMRKNSLFLMNCLKTRFKDPIKRAHVGQSPNVGNMRLGFFSQKQAALTHYQQRFEYMETARQRLLQAQMPQIESRLGSKSPLLPQPW